LGPSNNARPTRTENPDVCVLFIVNVLLCSARQFVTWGYCDSLNNAERKKLLTENVYRAKMNVNLSLCLIKHIVMKTYGGVEAQLHASLSSALD
jgi:hypothetical protein